MLYPIELRGRVRERHMINKPVPACCFAGATDGRRARPDENFVNFFLFRFDFLVFARLSG